MDAEVEVKSEDGRGFEDEVEERKGSENVKIEIITRVSMCRRVVE